MATMQLLPARFVPFRHADLDGRSSFRRPWRSPGTGLGRRIRRQLLAAWRADDRGQAEAAAQARLTAAWFVRLAMRQGVDVTGDPAGDSALLAELLRRAGELDGARAAARRGLGVPTRPGVHDVLRFQLRLVAAGDTGRHHLGEALSESGSEWAS